MINLLFNATNAVDALILFVLIGGGLIFSLVLHELGHGYAALINGDMTAKMHKRLSLNPAKHFDLTGFLMILIIGFGYAKPVPINTSNFKSYKKGLLLVSIAGVLVNVILAFILCLLSVIVQKFVSSNTMFYFYSRTIFETLAICNLYLCFFNLLPLFPLDGFHFINSLSRRENKFIRFMREYSMYILLTLIGLSIIVTRFEIRASWWGYLDILGNYLEFFGINIANGFLWFWRLIFGI